MLIVHAPKNDQRLVAGVSSVRLLSCSLPSRGPGPHSASFGGGRGLNTPTKTRQEQRLPKIRCCGAGDYGAWGPDPDDPRCLISDDMSRGGMVVTADHRIPGLTDAEFAEQAILESARAIALQRQRFL